MASPEDLEAALGYRFSDRSWLQLALTHRSHARSNNERLEFLGDSMLGFFTADQLYRSFPNGTEGELTRMRARLVKKESLAIMARRDLKLQDHVVLGEGELKSGGYNRDSILADSFEALIGAVYLDGSIAPAMEVMERLFAPYIAQLDDRPSKDNKTALQEILQKNNLPLPLYEVITEEGQSHDPLFTVSCTISLRKEPFLAQAGNRKHAEQQAALGARTYIEREHPKVAT